MSPVPVLAGAAVAVLVLTAATVVDVARDPEIRDCASAAVALRDANEVYLEALDRFDRVDLRSRSDGSLVAQVPQLKLRVDETKGVLHAARAQYTRLCHQP